MKISLTHSKLSKALGYASKAVSIKPNIPILSNVLLDVDNGHLKISATNLDMGIVMWIPGDVSLDGKTTVNGKYIADFVSAIDSNSVGITLQGNNLIVESEKSNASFTTISSDEFPVLPKTSVAPLFQIDTQEFIRSMEKVIFACSTDNSAGRIQQTGVLFDIDENNEKEINFVGLDGFRLSQRTSTIFNLNKAILKPTILVPSKLLGELVKILQDYSEVAVLDVFLSESGSQIIFKFEDVEFSIRLLEGPYPDYKKIMPDSASFTFEVKKKDLENAIKIINAFARGNLGNKTLFDFEIERSFVKLTSTVTEVGEGKTEFSVAKIDGDSDLNTAYTLRYLQDMVNHVKGQDIIFESKGPLAASVFKDKSDAKYIHLIMPMRRDL